MISQRERGELARFYTVTDPKKHQKGYTVYKVTARIISRKNPEDVQEITVWKRYSDFRKLHRDLWQLHRNLCGQSELFPPFAKAKVFGRFEDTVIEERRQCSEDLLQFSANIPALYSSQHIQDFFKGGEVHDGSELIGPAEPFSDFLADSLSDCSSEAQKEISGADDLTGTSQSEYGGPSSDSDLTSLAVDTDSPAEPDDGMASGRTSPNQPPPPPPGASSFSFSSSAAAPPTLSSSPLPVPGPAPPAPEVGRPGRAALLSLRRPPGGTPQPDYLDRAGQLIRLAAQREQELDYRAALACYHSGVDLLLQGVQGEPSPRRREAVKRCTAEYLMRAEQISNQHLRSSMGQGSTQTMDPGAQCVAPASRGSQQSPAEELSTYRVLGVIDKVLLVMDKRTQETFILKGLRKSSVIGRARRCVLPRAVPHMVRLSKFIVSEDTVFLLLRYAEGGKLWSHIGSFLRTSSPEDSFDIPFIQKSHTTAVCSAQRGGPSPSRPPGSDSASSGSSLPGAAPAPAGSDPPEGARCAGETLAPFLQRTGPMSGLRGSGGPRPDSGATSEEECTNSYLALCNEYEQEKEADGEEAAPAAAPEVAVATASPQTRSLLLSGDSLCSPLSAQELLFFTEATAVSALPAATDDAFVPLASKPELFSINSVDSAGEAAWCPDPASSSSSTQPRPLLSDLQPELAEEVACHESWGRGRSDGGGGGSDESVPVISFKEAAAAGEVAEVRPPDLLVNLPGVVGVAPEEEGEEGEEPACPGGACPAADGKAPPKLTQPDVLQRRHDPEGEGLTSEGEEPTSKRDARDKMAVAPARPGEEDFPPAGALSSAPPPYSSSSGADSLFADALGERLRSSLDPNRDEAASEAPPEPGEGEEGGGGAGGGAEADTSRLFAELDALSAAAAEARLPEELVQRWAAEMVSALDGLHREGVVCGDLNPNNILLTHQGHVELTYFCSWNEVEDSYDKEAITNMYCAPEVGGISEETEACDWWSLGAILFELLTGKSLLQCHPAGISRHTTLNVPESVSEEAKSLLEQLLQFNPSERLGAGVAGAEDIKSHPFFARVDWSK